MAALHELRAACSALPRQQHAALCAAMVDPWWLHGWPSPHAMHMAFRGEIGLLPVG